MPPHSDEDISLLGESTYEILSDSTILTEDEDDASSVDSFGGYSVEDITNFDDADSLHEYRPDSNDHPGIPSFGGLDDLQIEGSEATLRNESESSAAIEFEEPISKSGHVSVMRTFIEFNQQETNEILPYLRLENPPERLICTLRQTMSQELLFLEEPFRVLYVGATSARDEIFTKLGGALAMPVVECASSTMSTDSKSSRFNVVPVTSFGTKSSPEVELIESFGVEMALDVVSVAKSTKGEGRLDSISLCLNGNQWVQSSQGENGVTLDIQSWKLPHLAVVFCSEDDTPEAKLTRAYTRTFLGRHSVATIIIINKPTYKKPVENFALDTRSIHMCLESKGPDSCDFIYKRLPVDLATFTNLDVRQMNRNLAHITGLSRPNVKEQLSANPKVVPPNSSMQDLEKRPSAYSYDNLPHSLHWVRDKKLRDVWMVVAVGWLLICGFIGATFSVAYMKFSKYPPAAVSTEMPHQLPTLLSTVTPMLAITSSSSLARPTSKPVVVPSPRSPTSCATSVDLTSLWLEPTPLAANESQKFKIHIIGDNNIILRPPQKYVSLRKPPLLSVEVTRNGIAIETELSKLFDGVYTVVIPPNDAWGALNVSVRTSSKPLINELFELDLGTPWFRYAGWKQYSNQQFVGMKRAAIQISLDAKRRANEISRLAMQKTHEAQEAVIAKVDETSQQVKAKSVEISQHISKLRQAPLSINLSWPKEVGFGYIRKAQRRAADVWAKKSKDQTLN